MRGKHRRRRGPAFRAHAGRECRLGVADIDRSLVEDADALYVGGYFVLPAVDGRGLGDLYASARAAGVRTILDVVVPSGDEGISLDLLAGVLPHVDLFVPNEDEARA